MGGTGKHSGTTSTTIPGRAVPSSRRIPGAGRALRERPEPGPARLSSARQDAAPLAPGCPAPVGPPASECLPCTPTPQQLPALTEGFSFSRSSARQCELPKAGKDPRWPGPPRCPNTKRSAHLVLAHRSYFRKSEIKDGWRSSYKRSRAIVISNKNSPSVEVFLPRFFFFSFLLKSPTKILT